ncbi:MAG: DNRLRE domain-containing protein [Pirellulales bacterium]
MSCRVYCSLMCALLFASTTGEAATFSVETNQGSGQDGMIYSSPTVPFPLSTAYPVIATGATGGAHDVAALIQFDLSTVTATAADITSATLRVFSATSKSVNATNLDPDVAHPIEIAISPITSAWNRASVTWATQPTHGAVETTFSVDALGQFYTIDITDIVKDWKASPTPTPNFGLWLNPTTIMGSGPNQDQSPFYAVAFNSGFLASPPFGPGGPNVNGPLLTVNAVPEPSTLLLALAGAVAFVGRLAFVARRRKASV